MHCLLCQMRGSYLALPLSHVIEVMRPLPIQALPGTPASVLGACVMRGSAVPVVDANRLFGSEAAEIGRFVALRTLDFERRVALAVEAVVGTTQLSIDALRDLPPVMRGGLMAQLGALDAKLLVVLEAARILPPESAGDLEYHASGD